MFVFNNGYFLYFILFFGVGNLVKIRKYLKYRLGCVWFSKNLYWNKIKVLGRMNFIKMWNII